MKLSVVVFFIFWATTTQAQYFNEPVDPKLPSPQQTLGHAVGDWHARHDQIQHYFEKLASQSDHAILEVIGYTHEQRPLLQLVISSPDNLRRLDELRQQHQQQAKQDKTISSDAPVVILLGYGVHGNEPSGANSALVLAHYLTAVKTSEVEAWLNQAIILIQPSLNPDGNDRFAHWANMHRGSKPVADPQHREHIEPWPNGRPNHYWFDLNRDWLLLQHPESQARIAQFQQWLPNVVGDFHEMGTNSSFFFQPGIPSRNYPMTPKRNFELTAAMAQFHAAAFDARQQLYYSEESFDDFYIGKGSTYPDINGSIGILFEQASSRGHIQESINGLLSFKETVKNQFTASLSTIRGAIAKRKELLAYQQQFYQGALAKAKADKTKGFMLIDDGDQTRLFTLLDLLQRHHIEVYPLTRDWQDDDAVYSAGKSYYVPLQQVQYRLIKAAFSTQKNFKDNTFYDVSSWTLPYAFNIEFKELTREPGRAVAEQQWQAAPVIKKPIPGGAYAYAFSWQDQQAPLLLQDLLAEKLVVRAAMQAFKAETNEAVVNFQPGTMVIAAGLQQQDWFTRLQRLQQQYSLKLYAIKTGLTSEGSDLGSNNFVVMTKPEVLLIAGPGIDSTEAGEVWYNLERLAGISPSMVEPDRLQKIDLSRYSHIILADGNYRQWQDSQISKLKQWTEQGGVLWGHKEGAAWLAKAGLLQTGVWQSKELKQLIPQQDLNYADKEGLAAKQRIAGAIFSAELDLSHPLTFGIPRARLPLFKNDIMLLQPSSAPFINVALYSQTPHLAGYSADEYIAKISQGAAIVAHNLGQGRVIGMTDNPVFRGYFYGSSRILINAMFMGHSFSAPIQSE